MSDKFWNRVRKTDGCWQWTGPINEHGYGIYGARHNGVRTRSFSHRYSFAMANGPIPPGKCILHKCDNRVCVRPDHLWLGTRKENTADMMAKGRGRWPGQKKKLFGEAHPAAKLTAETVREIRASDLTSSQLAEKFNVGPPAIRKIRSRQRWPHI